MLIEFWTFYVPNTEYGNYLYVMRDWSSIEVDLIIADYFSMLYDELKGIPINKTAHRNNLKKLIKRNDGSIEFKHANISAVLIKLGLPFINGYKPRDRYQRLLEERIIDFLSAEKNKIEPVFETFAESASGPSTYDFNKVLEEAPDKTIIQEPKIAYERRPIKINYIEREQRNISLGEKGEIFVLEYEKWRLHKEGKESLADKIEWISKNDDGAGFDILSKNKNGTDRYIEVKTTKLSKETPIFFSKTEFEFSQKNKENYHLYRLFNFSDKPRMFNLKGEFDSFCRKEAIQFKGYF